MNWSKFDADRVNKGKSPSSAEKLASSIRGSLGKPGLTPEHKSKTTRGGSVVSRAVTSRSVVSTPVKKDMKRPAPAKGQKDTADSFRTKIRMAEHNRKKATAATPVETKHAPGSLEDLANKADAATRKATEHPSSENHESARIAHRDAGDVARKEKNAPAGAYHAQMFSFHNSRSQSEDNRPTGVREEHTDSNASHFSASRHQLQSAFMDTESRRRSDHNYASVAEAADTNLTKAHLAAVKTYTGNDFTKINNHLRGSKVLSGAAADKVNKVAASLDDAISRQPPLEHDMTTYRGVTNPSAMFGEVGSKVGHEFQDSGYTSTTTHASAAREFSNEAVIRVLNRQGDQVLKPHSAGAFGQDSEQFHELLIPRGSRFHVAADRMVASHDGTTKRIIDLVRK